ncbi:42195_t:CDS:2 [Gigaspora margarita]|uniref:42195_t:CDS:1 n=1 Tax=Gigaspora margarita TaxID=4874 RepID=A0ABM8W1T1_GIGMA|nr:42195_t:CDS:2 [Gigaspora margarita]
MAIENNNFNNINYIEDSTIYTSNFINYINQQSLEHVTENEIISINDIEDNIEKCKEVIDYINAFE